MLATSSASASAPKTAWLYVRESTGEQLSGHSPETQERLCRELAAQEGLRVTRTVVEAGSARSARTRKGLQAVLKGMRRGEFDVLLIWKYSRLHRNLMNQLQMFALAKAHNIRILAAADPRDEGDKLSKMSIYITGLFNEMESDTIREQSMAGTRARVMKGMPLVGNAPLYGYRWVEEATTSVLTGAGRTRKARLEPDPVESLRVQAMFRYLDHPDHSLSDCAAWMNAQGWPAPRGGPWRKATIQKLVKHPYFQGNPHAYRSQMVVVSDPTARGSDEYEPVKKQRQMAREDAVPLPLESVPTIVDPALAARVLARVRGRSSRRESPLLLDREQFLLSGGLLRCGHTLSDGRRCGGTLGPRRKRGRANHYVCHLGTSWPSGDPRKHYVSVPAEPTDRFTVAWLFTLLTNSAEAEAALRRLADDQEETGSERELAKMGLAEAERKVTTLKKLSTLLSEDEMGDFVEQFRQARQERDRWQQRLVALSRVHETAERMVVLLRRAVADARATLSRAGTDTVAGTAGTAGRLSDVSPLMRVALDERARWNPTPQARADLREVLTVLGVRVLVAPAPATATHGTHGARRESAADRLTYEWAGLREVAEQAAAAGGQAATEAVGVLDTAAANSAAVALLAGAGLGEAGLGEWGENVNVRSRTSSRL